ncbi:two component LuxR family transcriptional regulator [Oscillochloris trichoides DG-6]|uniref:Two component LuxR family transcriptional regulator n=1 Tax=Oscillochloris trichoides DG-6 TaxID=765420 RepID=E1IAN9_9CHLR|nr:response regulator transcription factor [Oscillochloris trichoides]EFO81813.1 two component LuxR family transcriptional regulator [Oscillochloris trichoides DG-6]
MIVDDHKMVRKGLHVFLSFYADIVVVAEAADGQQALDLCHQYAPDVILMDIAMPVMDGPTATMHIRAAFPHIQVLVLTSLVDETMVVRAIRAGALGYLYKDVEADQLAIAIRNAMHGRATIDAQLLHVLTHQTDKAAQRPDLTNREREVLRLLVAGKTNHQIADLLKISPATVRIHVSSILAKLGVNNRTEAAIIAVQHKLIP